MSSTPPNHGFVAFQPKRVSRKPIAVPVRFVTQVQMPEKGDMSVNVESCEMNVDLEDVFKDIDEQRLLAWELRADAEADLKRADSKHIISEVKAARREAAEAKRLAQPCHDLMASLQRQEAPLELTRIISREVQRAVREESEQLQGNLRQQLGEEMATAARNQMQELSLTLEDLEEDMARCGPSDNYPPKSSWASDLETISQRAMGPAVGSMVMSSGIPSVPSEGDRRSDASLLHLEEELRCAAEKAGADLAAAVSGKLQVLRMHLDNYAERWHVVWQEADQSSLGQTGRDGCTATSSIRHLEAILSRIAEVLELEARARQELELCLLGRVEEARQDYRRLLVKVISHSMLRRTSSARAPKVAESNADGFLRLIGGAVSSLSYMTDRGAGSAGPNSARLSTNDSRTMQPMRASHGNLPTRTLRCNDIEGLHPRQ